MPKKPHPADVANSNIVAAAVRFDIALFIGAGRYAKDSAATLDEARIKAARLVAENPNGRLPLIYGITADGRSGLVTPASSATNQTRTENEMTKKAKAKKPAAKKAAANGNGKAEARRHPTGMGKRAAIEAAAREGKLPTVPDFSADTHKRFRPLLAEVVALAKAGEIAKLRKVEIKPISSSPKAIQRYRDLCVIALSAK